MKSRLLLALLLFSVYCFGQDSSFQLKDYKYRTPSFKYLVIDIGLSGSVGDYQNGLVDNNSFKSFGLLPTWISYTKTISTDKHLHNSGISLQSSGYFSSSKHGTSENKSNNYGVSLWWNRNDRFYKNNIWFFELGNDLRADAYGDKRRENSYDYKRNDFTISNELSAGFGKGRVERVQDAQMALYILNDLKTQGLLSSPVAPELANSFAQLITDINNKRVFDFRRRRIYELTRIDSFLQSSGLASKTDIRHFTTVNDNWAYAINPSRLAGSSWYVRLKPGIGYSSQKSQDFISTPGFSQTEIKNFFWSITPEIGVEKYIPVNLKWQQNMGASLSYIGRQSKDNTKFVSPGGISETENKYYNWDAKLAGFWGFGYFPNNRTELGSTLLTVAYYYNDNSYLISPELNLYVNYFISYRTYLNVRGSLEYEYYHNSANWNNKYLDAGISISLSHIIF